MGMIGFRHENGKAARVRKLSMVIYCAAYSRGMKTKHTSKRRRNRAFFRFQNFTLGEIVGEQGREVLRKSVDGQYGSMTRSQAARAWARNNAIANDMPPVRNSGY